LRLFADIRTAPVPFFIRPVTSRISGSVKTEFLEPNFDTHFAFIEEQLATSGGRYLCGDKLTGADIMMGYPILVVTSDHGPATVNRERFPHMFAYAAALQATESYNKAVKKVVALEGEYVLTPS
jgi:glutathione S-transferase